MSGFFEELQRRKVYRVAAAYIVAAGFLIQIASAAFPAWELPNWSLRLVIVLLLIGFPIAVILAWAYDITPQGIQGTPTTPGAHRRRNLILLIVTAVIISASAGFFLLPRAIWQKIDKSVAVLPFQNLSSDPDNAYFADGIQEEVLTRLAKIGDLKVISRTSTQGYQSEPGNLAEIAKQLGVANILEGSVQKAGNQVRVNVHLVNVQTGSQLWAETYDRKLSDIFGVETEISKGIAESLQAKLTGREEQALAAKPTNNPQAYDAYLRGLAFEARSNYSSDALFKAIEFYDLAVRLDPNFALAWARLSGVHALLYSNRDRTTARRDAAKETLENAQKLQPNTPETLLFTGYYQFWVLHDYGLAKATFERVSKKLPGNSEVLYALAAIARSEGHWDESVAYWERGLALNPRNTALLTEVAFTYAAIRQFPKAEKLYDRALNILPNELPLMALKASIYQAEGNLQEAAKLLAQVNLETNSDVAVRIRLTQWRLERNHTEATRWVQARQDRLRLFSGIDKGTKQLGNALVHRVAGDSTQAKAFAEQARNTLEPLRKEQPDNAFVAAALAWLTPCSTRRNQPSTKRSAQSRFRRVIKIGCLDPLSKRTWR